MKKIIYLALTLSLACFVLSCANNKKARNYNDQPQIDAAGLSFIKNGMEAQLTAIRISHIARKASKNPVVIRFAKMMAADHHATMDRFKSIVTDNKLDGYPDTVSRVHKKTMDSISKFKRVQFDKAYMQFMIKDHEDALRLFNAGAQNKNNAIQDLAKKTIPTLQMHLDSAKAINKILK
ncbi:MAG: hypothetical protein JWP37_1518 [Mucilaginibacter sp.]|nr:hypothetical protein [Mucilaginibacter sp.]